MKLFVFSDDTYKSWILAENLNGAQEFYDKEFGLSDRFEVDAVLKKDWDKLKLVDPDEPEPEEDYNPDDYASGYKILMSFKEYIEKNQFTHSIASTEY